MSGQGVALLIAGACFLGAGGWLWALIRFAERADLNLADTSTEFDVHVEQAMVVAADDMQLWELELAVFRHPAGRKTQQ